LPAPLPERDAVAGGVHECRVRRVERLDRLRFLELGLQRLEPLELLATVVRFDDACRRGGPSADLALPGVPGQSTIWNS